MLETKDANYGVIIGRFQVDQLHEGHIDLIQRVVGLFPSTILLLGTTPSIRNTRNNPLPFIVRKRMIEETFPDLIIKQLLDEPTDNGWSSQVDSIIESLIGNQKATLFGSRDSFIKSYEGKYPTIELADRFPSSGTKIRNEIAKSPIHSVDFRKALIYSAYSRYPTTFMCVDVACVKPKIVEEATLHGLNWQKKNQMDGHQILLGRKKTDPIDKFRFFGGFVDPTETLEVAASREIREEAGNIEVSPPKYIGSFSIDDYRYRSEVDNITSALFICDFVYGNPQPTDDLEGGEVKWFPIDENLVDHVIDSHQQFIEPLLERLN